MSNQRRGIGKCVCRATEVQQRFLLFIFAEEPHLDGFDQATLDVPQTFLDQRDFLFHIQAND